MSEQINTTINAGVMHAQLALAAYAEFSTTGIWEIIRQNYVVVQEGHIS